MPIRPENRARYPKNWREISDRIRFVRAEGRCECAGECNRRTHEGRCPNKHGEFAYGTGSKVILTTAHLDHIPENCDDSNLKAMCQGCHLHYDKEHHAQTRAKTRLENKRLDATKQVMRTLALGGERLRYHSLPGATPLVVALPEDTLVDAAEMASRGDDQKTNLAVAGETSFDAFVVWLEETDDVDIESTITLSEFLKQVRWDAVSAEVSGYRLWVQPAGFAIPYHVPARK